MLKTACNLVCSWRESRGCDVRVGVPTEVKNHEYRVSMTPAGVYEMVRQGHDVLVQRGAGLGAYIPDE